MALLAVQRRFSSIARAELVQNGAHIEPHGAVANADVGGNRGVGLARDEPRVRVSSNPGAATAAPPGGRGPPWRWAPGSYVRGAPPESGELIGMHIFEAIVPL